MTYITLSFKSYSYIHYFYVGFRDEFGHFFFRRTNPKLIVSLEPVPVTESYQLKIDNNILKQAAVNSPVYPGKYQMFIYYSPTIRKSYMKRLVHD